MLQVIITSSAMTWETNQVIKYLNIEIFKNKVFEGFKLTMRTRSKTFSEGRACGERRQIIRISKEAEEEREEDVLIEEAGAINSRQRKMSVFEPRSAST